MAAVLEGDRKPCRGLGSTARPPATATWASASFRGCRGSRPPGRAGHLPPTPARVHLESQPRSPQPTHALAHPRAHAHTGTLRRAPGWTPPTAATHPGQSPRSCARVTLPSRLASQPDSAKRQPCSPATCGFFVGGCAPLLEPWGPHWFPAPLSGPEAFLRGRGRWLF
ncbi:uncharacterized protein LOC123943225 isoform X7 [Meles meles]|uniref:uncharacterized protein LOC123943225 isoform X7 n=1 Tax=Meles meles TaxID=9662 RepID=UPI001E698B18|nr:uncharacterized protein LOC123943225 isoform X7 [Meles meles]